MADAYEFFQETAANVQRSADPGYGTQVWFRELEKFAVIATEIDPPVIEGDTRIIEDTHTFTELNDGFIKASGHQDGGSMEGASQGEPGFQGTPMYKYKTFMVGDKAALREKVEAMKNRSFIMIFKDPNCSDTRLHQLGCDCDPAVVSEFKYTSGNRRTGGKKGYEITFESSCWFDYEGTVTERVESGS